MVESEQPADIKQKQEIVRSGFRLSYPGNWKVDTASEDYDPDHISASTAQAQAWSCS